MPRSPQPLQLGVNIDHIAVLREARRINDPDPLMALGVCAQNGAEQITIHLREDRRHIHDEDAEKIIASSPLPVNLECSINPAIIDIVCELRPHRATLVPENRQEVTTEGGLDVISQSGLVSEAIDRLHAAGIAVSLFVDPTEHIMDQSRALDAQMVELHTGAYANLFAMLHTALPYTRHSVSHLELPRDELALRLDASLDALRHSAAHAHAAGLQVAAGHGLNYHNVRPVVAISEIIELNIGQSIIARSVFSGLAAAVRDMKALLAR